MKNNFTISIQLLILIISILFCIILANLFTSATLQISGYESIDLSNPKIYLISGFFSQVVGFIGGFFLFLKIINQNFFDLIHIKKPIVKTTFIIIGSLIISFPLMFVLGHYNSFVKDWIPNNSFILQEVETDLHQSKLLVNNGGLMLFFKLFVVAVLPAIGEELIFRGALLTKIKKVSNNEHYAVFVSALLFAAIHLQPTKLLPMLFLGVVLGYIYTKTKNILYPMLFHFLFNGLTIIWAHFN